MPPQCKMKINNWWKTTMSENNSSKWEELATNQHEDEALLSEEAVQVNDEEADASLQNDTAEMDDLNELGTNVEDLQNKIIELEHKANENWEKALRATAEMDNIRRRAERDVENAHKYGNEKFIDTLIPVIDSPEQALQMEVDATNEKLESMRQGIELTLKLMIDAMERANVKQLDPVGEDFDPKQHEAMSMQVSPDAKPNTVLVVFQKGYLLNERVIRPARVIVAKGA